ncbi:MAG: hypothetical protein R3358_13395 [Woeseiaceae bacterium]|nr:hypothetical protein [Woeseiaceae bacterium]
MSKPADNLQSTQTAAEKRVLSAINAREVADFTDRAGADRQLSAVFVQQLLSGAFGELCCPLRICGADITGALRPPSITTHGPRPAVQFRDCRFDSPVDFSGAEFLMLRFVNCTLPAFIGASLSVRADLDFSGSQFSGVTNYESELTDVGTCSVELKHARIGGSLNLGSTAASRFTAVCTIRLDGAHIDGDVSLAGASLDGNGEAALSARSAVIGSNVELNASAGRRFEADGEVIFAASQITGDLNCQGARICNPDGRALHCEDMNVESVFLTGSRDLDLPFEARGRLNFLTAVIDGSFFVTNARLAPGPDYEGMLKMGAPVALNLQQARISNALAFGNVGTVTGDAPATTFDDEPVPLRGWFLLTGAQTTAILDDTDSGWPEYGFLEIDGMSYSTIRHVRGSDMARRRIEWLKRQFQDGVPDRRNFRPQPYEQLTRTLRDHGRAVEANAIAVEKIRMRLAARVDRPWARFFPNLLMLISQYGYSTSRALLSFLLFVVLGTLMYSVALFGFGQPFVPVENEPAPVTYSFAFGLLQQSDANGCPGLDVMHYALDAALPVIDLAQDLRCRFTPEGPARWLWLLLHSLYVLGGAALSAVVVLTLAGVLRQD